jgi:hypothetical protein
MVFPSSPYAVGDYGRHKHCCEARSEAPKPSAQGLYTVLLPTNIEVRSTQLTPETPQAGAFSASVDR